MTTELQQTPRDRFRDFVGAMSTDIQQVLPSHLDVDTMTKVILIEAARNTKLRLCTPASLAATIMLSAQLGLQPTSPLGHFYLIPRREKVDPYDRSANPRKEMRCGFIIGYRGLCELANRAGLQVNAQCIYKGEAEQNLFTWENDPPTLRHIGSLSIDKRASTVVGAYATAVDPKTGNRWQVVMNLTEIQEHKKKAQTDKVWRAHFEAMARKTALRRLLNGGTVPLSPELQTAMIAETAQELEAETLRVVETEPAQLPEGADPLRAVLQLDASATTTGGPLAIDRGPPSPLVPQSTIDRILILEGALGTEQLNEACKLVGLAPDADLAAVSDEQLAKYTAVLEGLVAAQGGSNG